MLLDLDVFSLNIHWRQDSSVFQPSGSWLLNSYLRRASCMQGWEELQINIDSKKLVPCKQNTQCQARVKSTPYFRPKLAKSITFFRPDRSYLFSPYKGVHSTPPPYPPPPRGFDKVFICRVIIIIILGLWQVPRSQSPVEFPVISQLPAHFSATSKFCKSQVSTISFISRLKIRI